MLHAVFASTAVTAIVMTLFPITHLRHWSVRIWDFPRLQIGAALVILLAVQIAWTLSYDPAVASASAPPSGLWALALLGCLGWHVKWIWPYSELHPQEVAEATPRERADSPGIRVLTSNVLMDNRDATRLIEHVRRESPDVLVTLESDAWWQEQLDVLDAYPHRIACPLDNRYGMHVYSRLPLHEAVVEYLVEDDVPSIGTFVELDTGERVRLHVVHPTPPAPGENVRSTERDVELLMLAHHLEDCRDPVLVTGDLNDVAWSATTQLFRRRSGLLDPRVGRGMFNTFHAHFWFLRWPLDHTFVSTHFRLLEVRRLDPIGSDHFPVLFDLALCEPSELASHLDCEDIDHELERATMNTGLAERADMPTLFAST